MKNMKYRMSWFFLTAFLMLFSGNLYAENIDPDNDGSQYAYAENVGWLNFEPGQGPGVHVSNDKLTGFVWAENIGWINLSPATYGGVLNDGVGNLSGYAWAENVGWINLGNGDGPYDNDPNDSSTAGVNVDFVSGELTGLAWGEKTALVGPEPLSAQTTRTPVNSKSSSS